MVSFITIYNNVIVYNCSAKKNQNSASIQKGDCCRMCKLYQDLIATYVTNLEKSQNLLGADTMDAKIVNNDVH